MQQMEIKQLKLFFVVAFAEPEFYQFVSEFSFILIFSMTWLHISFEFVSTCVCSLYLMDAIFSESP